MGEVLAGRYELVDLIGEGGMGTVWRARDLRSGEVVAAKVLRQADAVALLRFVREQAVRVHHPHVVVPLGWAGEDDRVVFAMPVIAGGSVASLVGDFGPLPPLFVAEVLRQVLDALGAVHAARLVHRDIKPANILLDATGAGRPHAYLSDFGIAVDLDGPRWTRTGYVTGTPGYLAPELESLGEVTPAADLFALGKVAATMLTGARPTDVDLTATAPLGVPESLWSLARDLAAPDADDRPARSEALERLGVPELAWRPDGVGDIEVFDHLAPLGEPPTLRDLGGPGVGATVLDAAQGGGAPVAGPAAMVSDAPVPDAPIPDATATGGASAASPHVGSTSHVGSSPHVGSAPPAARPGRPSLRPLDRAVLTFFALLVVAGILLIWQPWATLG